jgi:hypothetical protein
MPAPEYMDVTPHQAVLLDLIETELRRLPIPVANNQKQGIAGRRTIVMGYRRWYTRHIGPGRWNTKRPHLWNLLKHYGATLPIQWDCVQINENATCGRHTDKNNCGVSYIVSLGDYEGGELVIENPEGQGVTYQCKRRGLIFDGGRPHWNNAHTLTKFSLVFFQIEIPDWWHRRRIPAYPENWREDPEYRECMELTPVQA